MSETLKNIMASEMFKNVMAVVALFVFEFGFGLGLAELIWRLWLRP